jgi:quercetin dioxygenase-like cupin family protein
MVPLVMSAKDAPAIPGRRPWVEYRDFGVEEASGGLLSTQMTTLTRGVYQETGWHYHACTFQWIWQISGWVDLRLEDGTERRLEAGSVLFLPGGIGHNETATSDSLQLVEIFMPPHPETVMIDVPEAWTTA